MVPVEQEKEDRRRHPRWDVEGQLAGQIARIPGVSFVNVSMGGALIEHSKIVRPGTICFLTILVPGDKIGLKCRVVRSIVHRYEISPTGERDLVYRTGVKFLALSGAPRRQIKVYIDSLMRGAGAQATAVRS